MVLQQIIEERRGQDREHGGQGNDDRLSPNHWIAILARQVGLAASNRAEVELARYRRQLVRVAATAIAALDALDREQPPEPKMAGTLPESWRSGA